MDGANSNNNVDMHSNMPEPTMRDIFNLLTKCAQKEDIDEIKASISIANTENAQKIQELDNRIDNVEATTVQNSTKIQSLEISLEMLKQEQLKNNICISGVPPAMVKSDNNTASIVIAIGKALGVECSASQFTSYAVAGNKFIIVHFYNMKHKQSLMNKIRAKRSLMVEEAFNGNSNSQIYLNDHLTPYFNSLYLRARKAKAENKLASASSYGGKIRARKRADDMPLVITCESQLQALIDSDDSTNTSHVSLDTSNASADTAAGTSQQTATINSSRRTQRSAAENRKSNARKTHDSNRNALALNKPATKPSKRKLNTSNNSNNITDDTTIKKPRNNNRTK